MLGGSLLQTIDVFAGFHSYIRSVEERFAIFLFRRLSEYIPFHGIAEINNSEHGKNLKVNITEFFTEREERNCCKNV